MLLTVQAPTGNATIAGCGLCPRISSSLSIVPVIGSILRLLSSGVLNFLHEGRAPAAATAVSQAHVPFSSFSQMECPQASISARSLASPFWTSPRCRNQRRLEGLLSRVDLKDGLASLYPTARTPGDCAAGRRPSVTAAGFVVGRCTVAVVPGGTVTSR